MSPSSAASSDKLISVCLKRQQQSFYFLCDPSVTTPEYLKQQVQLALHPSGGSSGAITATTFATRQETAKADASNAAATSSIPSTYHMRIVSTDQDATTTPLQDGVTLEQQQHVKNQAVFHLIFAKPVPKESEFEQDDADDDEDETGEEELEWEEPNAVSYSLQETTRPRE